MWHLCIHTVCQDKNQILLVVSCRWAFIKVFELTYNRVKDSTKPKKHSMSGGRGGGYLLFNMEREENICIVCIIIG
jgi:hypothetical protein